MHLSYQTGFKSIKFIKIVLTLDNKNTLKMEKIEIKFQMKMGSEVGTVDVLFNPFKPKVWDRFKNLGGGAKRHRLEINKGAA